MIRFPKMHIAQSVVNRIMNVADDLEMAQNKPAMHVPAMPDATAQGAALDEALATPPAGVTPPEGAESGMLSAAIAGDSPVTAAIDKGIENDGSGF